MYSFLLSWNLGKKGCAILNSAAYSPGRKTPTSYHRVTTLSKKLGSNLHDEEDPGRSLSGWSFAPLTTLAAPTTHTFSSWLSFLSWSQNLGVEEYSIHQQSFWHILWVLFNQFFTFDTFLLVLLVDGSPERSSFSTLSLPSRNSLCHLKIPDLAAAASP